MRAEVPQLHTAATAPDRWARAVQRCGRRTRPSDVTASDGIVCDHVVVMRLHAGRPLALDAGPSAR